MNKRRDYTAWFPLTIAVSVILGIVLGIFMGNPFSNKEYNKQSDRKLNTILNLISQEYVDDSINTHDLIEMSIPAILANLDPHSSYLSASELKANQEELNGSFSGIGISFQRMNDTIVVLEVIPGGPSDRAGLLAGDKIVTIDDTTSVGPQMDANKVKEKLRGDKGTKVKVGIAREGQSKQLSFVITRGDVPMTSVDASYMIDKTTGYVKVSQFGRNTYNEFIKALNSLRNEGAKRFMVDMRGNGGGFLEIAVIMVNEFLPADKKIVSTKGRYRREENTFYSDGRGQFQEEELVVLIDEFSASASEVFAGAIQDNDRGLIVGNRSFGKGLVQQQFDLPDKSAIRLTIAKYYTPSGRCIQKPYNNGESAYQKDILDRYSNGELYSKDSIKIDSTKIFLTSTGRKVYGGGGIIPDIFVPRDTTGYSSYFAAVYGAGILQEYALKYVTENRSSLSQMSDYKQLLRNLPANDDLLNDFVNHAANKGIPARWYYIRQSEDVLTSVIKGLIARDVFGQSAYYPIVNRSDKTIEAALKALNKHKAAFPITNY
ncbi:MAG: S41 family peptidase [Muribaculaceae bacterium]|nr:S41 family peptidase [Muribaculaceae bacterium]